MPNVLRHVAGCLASITAITSIPPATAAAQQAPEPRAPQSMRDITPALARYTDETLFGQVWERPGLAKRDRSLVTVSALISGGKTEQLTGHLGIALDNGLTPQQLSAIITHLAFYSGWPNSVSAIGVTKKVFEQRGIDPAVLREGPAALLQLDSSAEARRMAMGERSTGTYFPQLNGYANDVLFGNLWRRPDLSPRDRSLVTIAALIAGGNAGEMTFHLQRGLDNGLTTTELSEAVTHLAFYAGWPNAMAAVQVANPVFAARVGASAKTDLPMQIFRRGSSPKPAPAANFTGTVTQTGAFQWADASPVSGATVTFARGARTAWHSHPLGQTLVVTEGCGWTQRQGAPVERICTGDVVRVGAGERHWHGATRTSVMTHVAIAGERDGRVVQWMEQVADTDYTGPAG